jgi:integrase
MKRARGEGRLFRPSYKGKDGRVRRSRVWWLQFTDPSRPKGRQQVRESSQSTRRTEAARLLQRRLELIRQGRPAGPDVDRVTLGELLDGLVTEYQVNARRSLLRVQQVIAHLVTFFDRGFLVRALREDRIEAYVARRQKDGAKNATINRELAVLKRALRLGERSERVVRRPHIAMLEENNRRKGFFEPEEFGALLANLPEDLCPLARIAYITGWRVPSELRRLQWRHVDFAVGLLRIEDSKNREARQFPFTPELRSILEAQRARTTAMEEATGQIIPWVFWRRKGPGVGREGQPVGLFRRAWITACRKAGIPGKIPHDFRRTAVRNLERAGVPRSAAMAMVGHKTEAIYRRYAIVDEAMLREGAEKLARLHEAQQAAIASGKVVPFPAQGQVKGKSTGEGAANLVAWDGIEPPTRGFSVRCSTN